MKKKLLAILLTVCMVLSMAPAALAADSVFTDVKADDWFADEVKYVYDNGLMNGVGDNAFDPSGSVTRAMVWTTLARLDGVNTAGSDPWWLAGQKWAMENGISDGTMAENNITREQLVTMIWRYAKYIDMDVSEGEDTNILSYTDALDVNEWAISAMQWACGVGIINGIDGALQPQGNATRAQLAAILYRFVEEVANAAPAAYTVTFMWNYGDKGIYETVEVDDGKTVGSLRNPSRSGYTFSGWYTEDGDRFTLSTKVTEDIVVYAKWSKDVYIPSHTHSYGDWTANDDGTHTGFCACGDEKTEDCAYGEYGSNEDGTHSRTCFKCNGVETGACTYTDHICGNCGHDVSDGVTILYPQNTASENYDMLKAAIDDARDGDVIYLGAGTFELQTVLEINNKSISIVGVEDGVVLKNVRSSKGHLFTVKNHTNPENNPQVIMTNLTLDQNENPNGHGIYVRGNVTLDLYDVVITNTTAAGIIIDHAYAYDDGNYYDGTSAIVNAFNVDLDDDGFVQMGALPMSSVCDITTYAEFNYDVESAMPSFKADSYNRGYGNLTVNGEPLYPEKYFVEMDGIIYLMDSSDDSMTLYLIPENYAGTTLTVAEGTTALRGGVFAGTDITTVTIPATVTDFGATGVTAENASGGAFKGSDVTTVVLEDGMTEIPAAAFNGAKQLISISIPASVETIGIHAFRQTALTELTIPATVTTIGFGAFRDMPNLTTVTVEGDAMISSYAFRTCAQLETVYLNGENVTFQSGKMIFSHADTGADDGITVYVANADVEAALNAVQKEDDGFKIVVLTAYIGDTVYESLQEALDEVSETKGTVVLAVDVEMEAATTAPYGNKYALKMAGGTLDGDGHELYVECYGDDYGIMTSGGTVKNLTIEEGCRAIMIMYPTEDIILDKVQIGGDGVLYPINTGETGTNGSEGIDLIVSNSTLKGWTSFGDAIESASFTNVSFEQGTYYNNIYGRVLKPYVNTTLTDCDFIEHMNLDLSSLIEGQKVTIENCTVNGQAVTADVFTVAETDEQYDTELFTIDLPSWADSLADCLIIDGKIPVAEGLAIDPETGAYEISSAAGLFNFAKQVNEENNNFSGKTVKLVSDIDLANAAWTPIGQTGATEFRGVFDGQNYTISNLNIDSSAQTGKHYSSGLFGWSEAGAQIKNVEIDGATVKGNHNVAVIVGYTYSNKITNCHVSNADIVCTHANNDACGDKTGIIVGYAGDESRISNCSATDCTVVSGRDGGQLIGAGYNVSVSECTATNVTVTAGGDCTGANINEALIGRVLG